MGRTRVCQQPAYWECGRTGEASLWCPREKVEQADNVHAPDINLLPVWPIAKKLWCGIHPVKKDDMKRPVNQHWVFGRGAYSIYCNLQSKAFGGTHIVPH
jgi:hypothetical protein